MVGVDGGRRWYREGQLHREDGPAIEEKGRREWYIFGRLHREYGPAIQNAYGVAWFRHGKKHRDDGPAVEAADGRVEWWTDGRLDTWTSLWSQAVLMASYKVDRNPDADAAALRRIAVTLYEELHSPPDSMRWFHP